MKNKEKFIPKYWETWENVKKQCFFAIFSVFLIFHKILVVKSFESFSQRRWDQCMYFVNFFQNFIRWIFCKTHLLSHHNSRNHMRNFVPSPLRKIFWIFNVFPTVQRFTPQILVQIHQLFVENGQFFWKSDLSRFTTLRKCEKKFSATCAGKHQWSKRTWKSSEFSLFSSTCCWKMTGGRLGKANWCPQKCKRAKKSVFCPCCYKRKMFSCSPCYFSYSPWHFSCLVYAWFMQWLPTIEDGKEK